MTTFAQVLDDAIARQARAAAANATTFAQGSVDLLSAVAAASAVDVAVPAWAEALGLRTPCTEADVKAAFRRRAFATHPDRPGGSEAAFLRVTRAHDEALLALRARSRRTR